MKRFFFLVFVFAYGALVRGQDTVKISSGAHVKVTNKAYLVLKDISLKNNGTLEQAGGDGTLKFTGPADISIVGSGITALDTLQLAKEAGTKLRLLSGIDIVSGIYFTGGLLDMENSVVDLGMTGQLLNESESSRAYTSGSGYLQAVAILNAPIAQNPGNFGAVITSPVNMGSTIIRRGHAIQEGISGDNNSIERYFDISPTNNATLKATLRVHYFDAELNGIAEETLHQWKSPNNTTWDIVGADTRDLALNYVERKAIAKFQRWTLARAEAPFITCPDNLTVSANLSGCKATVPFTGSSAATATGVPQPAITYSVGGTPITPDYVFPKGTTTVTATASNGVGADATCTFTITVVCGPAVTTTAVEETKEEMKIRFVPSLRPNPSDYYFNVVTSSGNDQPVTIRIFDVLGRLMEVKHNIATNTTTPFGHNYRPGIYYVEVSQGKEKVTIKAIKQIQ